MSLRGAAVEGRIPTATEAGIDNGFSAPSLDPGHPRDLKPVVGHLSSRVYKQLLGLNPFKASFPSLYRSNLSDRKSKIMAILGLIAAIAAGIPLPIMFVIFGKIINAFPPTEEEIRVRITQLLSVAVAYFAMTTFYMSVFGRVGDKIAITVREKLLKCLLHLDQAYYDTHDLDVTALLTAKVETIQVGTSEKVGIFVQSTSYFVAAFTVGFVLNAKLTGILFAAVIPAMVIVVALGSHWVSKLTTQLSKASESANALLESALRAIKVVQAFDIEDDLCRKQQISLQDNLGISIRKAIISACMFGSMYGLAYAANALAFFVGSGMTAGGEAGTVYAVCLLILDASFVVGQFAPFLEIFARATAAGEEIEDLIEKAKQAGLDSPAETEETPLCLHGQAVSFEDVQFTYPARPTAKVLNDLTLRFQPGTLNAVVGTSGGGKSTLVSLLLKIYESYSGTIRIGTHDLRRFDATQLRAQISVVEQDSILFTGSVRDNILHGLTDRYLPDASKHERCQEALLASGVDFIEALPNGLDSVIDNSLQLSGGQKQRLCLARALINRPAILILDEPTSALDARSETLVAQTVSRVAASGTTVIMIAHRLSTILGADNITVLSDGKVVESGTPDALAVPGTIFNGLLETQGTTLTTSDSDVSTDLLPMTEKAFEGSSAASNITSAEGDQVEETEELASGRVVVQKLARLIKADALLISVGLVCSAVSGAIIVGEAITFGNLITLLNSDTPDLNDDIRFYCLMFFILACIALVSYAGSGSAFGVASARLTGRIQRSLFRTMLRQDMKWFAAPGRSVHELMARINSDSGNLAALSGVVLGTLLSICTSMVGGITLSLVVAWKIAIVLLCCVPVLIAAGYLRLRLLHISEDRHRNAYNDASAIAAEACRSIRTIAILGMEDGVLERYKKALKGPFESGLRFTIAANALLAFSFAVTYFVYSLAYWWGSKQVREGAYTSTQFFIILPALLFSAQGAGQAFSLTPEITRAKSAARNIVKLLSSQPTILREADSQDATRASPSVLSLTEKSGGSTPPKILFENVSLHYGNDSKPALQDVSLSITEGHSVALVGPSGAGKSTAITLIERFLDPSSGNISINGVDIKDINARRLRAGMSLVPQEPDLFPGSISYNVKLGAAPGQTVTQLDIEAVCKQCGVHEFIVSLPDGYNTDCASNNSVKLSGGQGQRLAIARAMIRKPEILLLDEPTSALDAHSERLVQDSLEAASKGRTTVTVAHRLASVQAADCIFVFDEGRIVERGTHSELIDMGGLYASMAKAQSVA
ncbi:hypothetical protein B0A48_03860 [Cryoendolithus antarcticus]|uniref:Leptomycin B resistance protein pmd1 n=1 Tax=Cryoendolithus antarcticus TaxID=1507870 RepID=A0A1V8TH58_9PEZI|nr:hypothetical protein B0A48_03860 [Cryoendolithus antarcticus]